MTNMTIANQNAAILANTARSEAAIIKNGTRRTIAQIQDNWNECVKQAGFAGVFETPVYYKLKKAIASFLERAAEQLDQFQMVENERAATAAAVAAGEIPAPAREEIVFGGCTDMDAIHAEALEINEIADATPASHFQAVFFAQDEDTQRGIVEIDHAEALEMNQEAQGETRKRYQDYWFANEAMQQHIEYYAHKEALEMEAQRNLTARQARFVFHNTAAERAAAIEVAHAEALEENYRFGWLSNRFNLFWGGCDSPTRRGMTERAHNEALNINQARSVKAVLLN